MWLPRAPRPVASLAYTRPQAFRQKHPEGTRCEDQSKRHSDDVLVRPRLLLSWSASPSGFSELEKRNTNRCSKIG